MLEIDIYIGWHLFLFWGVSNFSDVVKHLKRMKVEKYAEMPGGIICCPGGQPVVVIFVAYGSKKP